MCCGSGVGALCTWQGTWLRFLFWFTRRQTIINYSAPIRRLRQVEPHMLGKFTSNHVQVYHQYSRPVPVKKPVKAKKPHSQAEIN
uniref:HDC06541 n=1 Tax=Drosophila melanogaster TaxID=7227 RepID=Q6IGE1_DROME|nr:TPA_inf: HDC06541 [Drosophila melanogaster]